MIYLYHGTVTEIGKPDPKCGRRGTDFGQGFYLTPNFESAKRMAQRVANRNGVSNGVVMCYAVDECDPALAELKVLHYPRIELEWLRFVVANRYFDWTAPNHNLDARWDVVYGLVADDRVVQILNDLRDGFSSEEEALKKLREAPFQTVQYSVHTARAVEFLRLLEVKHV